MPRPAPTRAAVLAVPLLSALCALSACAPTPDDAPPDLLLVVLDTVRADAVSAYGEVDGTTPFLDGLAASGLRYQNARADASWTLPAHASLFTGLIPPHHGVGTRQQMIAPADLTTLAMRLRERGYQTAGFSENPVVSEAFGLSRGFDHFESRSIASVSGDTPFGIEKRLRAWLAGRDVQKPFFVMLNLMDAHDPYSVRESNAYLPDATTRAQALESTARFEFGICDALPPPRHIAILRGLYLGDVNAADRKLGSLHRATAAASRFGLVSVVTSDHGEHFGERRLLNHQFSVADPLLRIPLIVHGLPGRPGGGVVAEPVTLVDVTASVLSWSGAEVPAGLDGVPLPMPGDPPLERTLFGFYADWRGVAPDHWPEGVPPLWAPGLGGTPTVRSDCGPADAVFGDMAAVFEGPLKLIAFEDRPSELYDLSWDAAERSDQAPHEPELVSRLEARLEALKRGPRAVAAPTLGAEASEALRALGYLD